MIIYLYVKQHSITGLKYFGKTVLNPFEYSGSGKRWKLHIRKHQRKYIKTLEVWGFDNQKLCTEFALKFSEQNNIVESDDWANLTSEDGLDGVVHNEYTKNKISKSLIGRTLSKEHRLKNIENLNRPEIVNRRVNTQVNEQIGIFNPNTIKIATERSKSKEAKQKKKLKYKEINHQQGCSNSQFGTKWITNGSFNKKISKSITPPEGWRYGRV